MTAPKLARPKLIARRTMTAVMVLAVLAAVAVSANLAWLNWGTGLETAQQQAELAQSFGNSTNGSAPTVTVEADGVAAVGGALELTESEATDGYSSTRSAAAQTVNDLELAAQPQVTDAEFISEQDALAEGQSDEAVARIEIPKIEEAWYVVSGVTDEDLKRGPGHYTTTPGPGELGNFAIAGHRSGYGAPFHDLHKLEPGDEIFITKPNGEQLTYIVKWISIVEPDDNWVLRTITQRKYQLTLTSCHPTGSLAERIVVRAEAETT